MNTSLSKYIVVLADRARDIPFQSTAHFFDLDTRRIKEIEPLPIVRGKPLKPLN